MQHVFSGGPTLGAMEACGWISGSVRGERVASVFSEEAMLKANSDKTGKVMPREDKQGRKGPVPRDLVYLALCQSVSTGNFKLLCI